MANPALLALGRNPIPRQVATTGDGDLSRRPANAIEMGSRARMPWALLLAMAVSTIGFISLGMHLPIDILANAGFDDALFVAHANSIVAGQWLGPYSQITLAKGPGYPIFLAINAVLGLPVTLTQALLYSGSCALLALTLFRIFGGAWVYLLVFLLMQWHPAMFTVRVVRDDLSASQVLLILSCVCRFVFLPARLRDRLLWAATGGLVLGWFWITREDALWVLPGLAVICGLQALRLTPDWRELRRLGISVVAFGLIGLATIGVVAAINLRVYGTFSVVDIKNPAFAEAFDIVQSVRAGAPVPYVPVPAKVRKQLDTVSPAFASLEPYFNGQGRMWTQFGCAVHPATCNDFAGGWFIWAFRDAAGSQGYYRTPATAAAFYRRLRREVNTACKAKRLECQKNILPFMPAMGAGQWNILPYELRQIYRLATWQGGELYGYVLTMSALGSTGTFAQVHQMDSFLGNPTAATIHGQNPSLTVAGWFRGAGNKWLEIRCTGPQGDMFLPVARQASPDLVAFFHDPSAAYQRFEMTLPPVKNCGFQAVSTTVATGYFDIGTAVVGSANFAGGTLAIDKLSQLDAGRTGRRAVALLTRTSHFYGRLIPAATALALAIYAISLVWAVVRDRRRRFDPQLIILTGVGTLLLARAGILVLVDISSFPAILPSYWSAGYPLLSLAIVLSLARLPVIAKAWRRNAYHRLRTVL